MPADAPPPLEPVLAIEAERDPTVLEVSPRVLAWRRFRRSRTAVVALVVVGAFLALAAFAPILPIADPTFQHREALLAPPSGEYLFGTDHLGRDIFSRVIHGLRTSFVVVAAAVAIAMVAGTALGVAAGYLGGWVDSLVMRSFDALLAFPTLLLAIAVTAVLGPSAFNAAIALGIVGTPRFARLARSDVLREREREYVEAARALGATPLTVMRRHLLPNIMGTLLVQITLFVAFAILVEAALSFLGLGVQVPRPSLGSMLTDGRPYFRIALWYAIAPGLVLTVLILAVNIVSDRLRDALDPQSTR